MLTTTRQGYRKPIGTELFDIAHQNFNWDLADVLSGVTICTSGTRPSTPPLGMLIYETDTGQQRCWNGTIWALTSAGPTVICTSATRPSPSVTGQCIWETDTSLQYICTAGGTPGTWTRMTPEFFGVVGGNIYNGSNATLVTMTNNTTEQTVGMDTGPITLVGNRTYRIRAMVEYDDVAAGLLTFRIRVTNTAGAELTRFRPRAQVLAATRQQLEMTAMFKTGASPSPTTYVVTAQRDAANATVPHTYKSTTTAPHCIIEKVGIDTVVATV